MPDGSNTERRERDVRGQFLEPDYATRFAGYLAGSGGINAALQTDIADRGGYLAPPQFVAELTKELATSFWFRQLARVLPPTTAPEVHRVRRDQRADSFLWTAELAEPTVNSAMRLGLHTLAPHYMSSEFEISVSLLQAAPSAEGVVQTEIVERAGDAEEAAFVAGDGIGKPLGIFTPSAFGVGTSRDITGNPNSLDTYHTVRYSLRAPYLRSDSLRWLMNPLAGLQLSKLKSGTGEPIWKPSGEVGKPDMLAGVPIAYSDNAPTGSGTNGAYQTGDYFAAIGALDYYDIQDGQTYILRLKDSERTRRNVVGFIARRKLDGKPRVAEAFARLKVA